VVLDRERTATAGQTDNGLTCTLIWHGGHVSLQEGTYLLGREESLPIRLPFPSVPRRHARMAIGGGAVTIVELGSKNAVFLRDTRLTAPTLLRDGDLLLIGSARIRVRPSESSTETAAPAGRNLRRGLSGSRRRRSSARLKGNRD